MTKNSNQGGSCLNPSKATGPDDISSTDLKLAAKNVAGTIAMLFNESLQTGDLPDEFKLGHVIPILKPGKTDTSLPSSYRGSTLTSILSKVLEKVVYKQVNTFLNDTHALNEQQYGFRKGRSCADLLTATVDDWLLARDRKLPTAIVFLDLSKAFANAQHEQLLQRLQKLNIGGTVLNLRSTECASLTTRILHNSPPQSVTGVWTWVQKKKVVSNALKGRPQKVVLHGHGGFSLL